MDAAPAPPTYGTQKEHDIALMLAAQCHLGTKNCSNAMERYVFRRNDAGIHIIHLEKTYEKLKMAARVIVAIENPQDVMALSARPYGQRAVLKFSQYLNCKSEAGRHTPGTFTNQIQKRFEEPRLIIVTDPRTDHQPVKEAAYMGIPCIAFADTDSPLHHVDIAIPVNNKSRLSIGLMYYLLARMVLEMRGVVTPEKPFSEVCPSVDLFFYREPEETEAEEVAAETAGFGGGGAGFGAPAADVGGFGGFGDFLPGEKAAALSPADAGWGGPAPEEGGFEAAELLTGPPQAETAGFGVGDFGGGFAPAPVPAQVPPPAAGVTEPSTGVADW
eukprot:CAMPEP_0202393618 /NCGR_PEP_ID=MMETSP1127-20130417/93002_1 /ASSEMBLY_ACC=CAM_ASM_000462 /TAXON_ID=3047 /ORGANISM="Dunaliella tertiolecta, Strain CCMP1320" /LENGTH=329 /DNA_ID=CAMNT_0048996205 /DNA_START=497 /DNA_END=1483 /DNA_ORIENTATION=-